MSRSNWRAEPRIKKSGHFPDGLSASAYGDFSLWTQEQWAWEFLRRSTDYQAWYDEWFAWRGAQGGGYDYDDDEPDNAFFSPDSEAHERSDELVWQCRHYGLRKPAEWRHAGLAVAPTPEFITERLPGVYLRAKEDDPDFYEDDLRVGEMVVKFDLNELSDIDGFLDRQLETVRARILERLPKFGVGSGRAQTRLRSSQDWITLVRLLDAMSNRIPLEQRVAILGAPADLDKRGEMERKVEEVKSKTQRAREMSSRKYLEILALTNDEFDRTKRANIVKTFDKLAASNEKAGVTRKARVMEFIVSDKGQL